MPLNKATKTVLFSEGMGDGTDRFLLESPAVDYAHNLRIDKQGSLQKRPGFGPDVLASVPNSSGTPIAMHGIGSNLHVLVNEGARTWDGSAWRERDAKGFLGGSEVELETQSFRGLSNCSYQPLLNKDTDEVKGHVIAYEVREEGSVSGNLTGGTGTDAAKHIIVQRYDENGLFVDQVSVPNARSPQVVFLAGATRESAAVFCQSEDEFGSLIFSVIEAPYIESSINWNTITTLIQPDYDPQMPQYSDTDAGPRLGQGVPGQARYFAKYMEATGRFVVFSGTGFSCRLSTIFPTTGAEEYGENIFPSDHGSEYDAIDVLGLDVNQSAIFVLYQVAELSGSGTPVAPWAVYAAQYGPNPETGPVAAALELHSGVGSRSKMPTFTHGTIGTIWNGVSGDYTSFLAFHYSGYNSASVLQGGDEQVSADYWYPWNTRNADVGLRVFEVSWLTNTYTRPGDLHGHRITTNPCYFDNKWYMGVQQWLDYTPQHEDPGGCNQYVLADAAFKPVTTALCVWGSGGDIRPMATLDAGQSTHVDYAESEMALHVGTLMEHEGALLASNRVKLSAGDASLYLGAANSKWKRYSNTEVGSDSLCRVHRITPGGEGVYASEFGDGIALSTALPLWYEASGFGEFGPLDSPEILRVEDADYPDVPGLDNNEWMQNAPPQGYSEFANNNTLDFRKFVCVWGYTDGSGNAHRSAPSATLYVADLLEDETEVFDATQWRGREVTVFVTTPLSILPADREYFLEIYVSTEADTDPQLAAQAAIDLTDHATPKSATFQLNRVVPSDESIAKPVIRSTPPPYTSGGVLAADPWPSFSRSVVQSTRLWALDKSNRGRVIYSKLFEDYISPEYSPTLSINLGDERDLTAIGKLDDKVIVFEPDDIHIIYGEGPDNRGQGQDFAVHYISTDVGCEDQESVIETPVGLIFYSKPRGFYLLDRNLQVQFIGEGIEDTARGVDILSATLVRDKAEVRFAYTGGPRGSDAKYGPPADTTAIDRPPRPVFTNAPIYRFGDHALTFNYERKTWMTYTNYDAQAAAIYQNKYTMLRGDWTIWQEKEDRWDDPSGFNLTSFTTPWIKLSENIQGFNRLWRMTVLGRYLSSLQDLGWADEGGPYVFDDKVGTGGGFAPGEVRFNAADLIDATVCRVHDIDDDGTDQTSFLDRLTDAAVSVLTDAGHGCVFQCSWTTDVGGYHELDIVPGSIVIHGDPLINLDNVTVSAQKQEFEGGDLQVKVYYDYEAFPAQTKLFRIQDFEYDRFNDPVKRAQRFQMEITPIRGRCQAVKLEFSEQLSQSISEGITYKQGRGFEIVATDFHVGIQPSKTLIPQRSKK